MRQVQGASIAIALLAVPVCGFGQSAPDAVAVEWQGKKLCDVLHEDAQIRVLRCVFPPGSVHVRHSHPGTFGYVVSGGRGEVENSRGKNQITVRTASTFASGPTPWHEFTNIGDTTLEYVIVEKKYEPLPSLGR